MDAWTNLVLSGALFQSLSPGPVLDYIQALKGFEAEINRHGECGTQEVRPSPVELG